MSDQLVVLRWTPVAQLRSRVFRGLSYRDRLNRSAVRADFGPHITEIRRIETHPDNRIAAPASCLIHQTRHRLIAALNEVLRHPLQFTAKHAFDPGAHLRDGVSRPDGDTEYLAADPLDFPAREFIGSNDQHYKTFLS